MGRKHARILCSIWEDDDFRGCSADAQRMYFFLLSQPKLNLVGVLDLTPRRWAASWKGGTVAKVEKALDDLIKHRFVLVDESTQELLIRTYVRHDLTDSPKLAVAVRRQFLQVVSPALRRAVSAEMSGTLADRVLHDLPDTPADTVSETVDVKIAQPPTTCRPPPAAAKAAAAPAAVDNRSGLRPKLLLVARLVAERRGLETTSLRKDNPERWLAGAVNGIATEIHDVAMPRLARGTTVEQIADDLEPRRAPVATVTECDDCGWAVGMAQTHTAQHAEYVAGYHHDDPPADTRPVDLAAARAHRKHKPAAAVSDETGDPND